MNRESIASFIPIVLQACVEASLAIMEVYETAFETNLKQDGSPVTIADKRSNELLLKALNQTNIPVISEESNKADYSIRKHWEYVWIVDPLDGTKEFIKKNGEFVICVALVHHGNPILGIICSPVEEEIILGGQLLPVSITKFHQILQPQSWSRITAKSFLTEEVVISGSRSHHAEAIYAYHEQLIQEFSSLIFKKKGSALKFFDLALGKSDIYARLAPTMEWDIAAGQAIIEALGGEVVQVDSGKPLVYNKENLLNPFFVVNTKAIIESRKK